MNAEYTIRKTTMTIASLNKKPYEMPWLLPAFTGLAASGLGGGCCSEERKSQPHTCTRYTVMSCLSSPHSAWRCHQLGLGAHWRPPTQHTKPSPSEVQMDLNVLAWKPAYGGIPCPWAPTWWCGPCLWWGLCLYGLKSENVLPWRSDNQKCCKIATRAEQQVPLMPLGHFPTRDTPHTQVRWCFVQNKWRSLQANSAGSKMAPHMRCSSCIVCMCVMVCTVSSQILSAHTAWVICT